MLRSKKIIKTIAWGVIVNLSIDVLFPTSLMALTGGPSSPDFASFEPVASTDMVNLFSGDFTYNLPVISIPGAEGGGYAMSLSYHGGLNQELESSWVGLGWSLNPGAINRGLRGFPDDYDRGVVKQFNKTRPMWTVTGGKIFQYGVDRTTMEMEEKKDVHLVEAITDVQRFNELNNKKTINELTREGGFYKVVDYGYNAPGLSTSLSSNLRYNNYTGYLKSNQLSTAGKFRNVDAGLNLQKSANDVTIGISIGPSVWLKKRIAQKLGFQGVLKEKISGFREKTGFESPLDYNAGIGIGGSNGQYGVFTFGKGEYKIAETKYVGRNFSRIATVSIEYDKIGLAEETGAKKATANKSSYSFGVGAQGSFSIQSNLPSLQYAAQGFMYAQGRDAIEDRPKKKKELEESENWVKYDDKSYLNKVLSDYYVEKISPYMERKTHIGMPVTNYDMFSASGEGVGGGFRLVKNKLGQFYPNFLTNRQLQVNIGYDLMSGVSLKKKGPFIGIGLDIGVGIQQSEVSAWKKPNDSWDNQIVDRFQYEGDDDKGQFRFSGDLGGKVLYSNNVNAEVAQPTTNVISIPGLKKPRLEDRKLNTSTGELEDRINIRNLDQEEAGATAYVEYKTNRELLTQYGPSNANERLDKLEKDQVEADRNNFYGYPSLIGEIGITNPGGARYKYGLPVYARKEAVLQISPNKDNPGFDEIDRGDITNVVKYDPNIYVDTDDSKVLQNDEVVGEYRETPYATSFLLTDIRGANYIDINDNGPDESDLGSWVKFRYHKKYGAGVKYIDNIPDDGPPDDIPGGGHDLPHEGNSPLNTTANNLPVKKPDDKWYIHRTPYNGYYYNKGRIANQKDDMMSVSRGEKEVYYLNYVETNTHIAFFVTNDAHKTSEEELPEGEQDVYFEQEKRFGKILDNLGVDADKKHELYDQFLRPFKAETRKDGYGAAFLNTNGMDPAGAKGIINEELPTEYLDRVVLFSKSNWETPSKTVRFEYDYSMVPGTPNSKAGKLTLKRVWSEHNGRVNSKVAPYVFKYHYKRKKDFEEAGVISFNPDYESILDHGGKYDGAENPPYSHGLDPWSNYQLDGEDRQSRLNPWKSQKDYPEEDPFDPACWHLKQVILPSGGEIHIQYEEKDYRYVQDKEAMSMVSLLPIQSAVNQEKERRFYLNLADLGIEPGSAEATEQMKLMREAFRMDLDYDDDDFDDEERDNATSLAERFLYFKYLYGMTSDLSGDPLLDLESCNSEYIDGFSFVEDIGMESNGQIYVELGSSVDIFDHKTQAEWAGLTLSEAILEAVKSIRDKGFRDKNRSLPRKLCYQHYLYNMGGMTDNVADDCAHRFTTYEDDLDALFHNIPVDDLEHYQKYHEKLIKNGDMKSIARNALWYAALDWEKVKKKKNQVDKPYKKYKTPEYQEVCVDLNYEMSYLRVPVYKPKKGGGVRVKRVVMFDEGIDSGDPVFVGSEYRYENEDGLSSGVATNEPNAAREENPLYQILKGKKQSLIGEMFVGKKNPDQEGPIAESFLPAASVAHSRIVVQNIYSGKSGQGYAVHKYHTCKDYPMFGKFKTGANSDLDEEDKGNALDYTELKDNTKRDWLGFDIGVFGMKIKKSFVSQGYRLLINDMHGKLKKVATYKGKFVEDDQGKLLDRTKFHNRTPVSFTEYEYFDPGEKMDMVHFNRETGVMELKKEIPGKEMEIAMDTRKVSDKSIDFKIGLEVWLSLAGLTPGFGWSPSIQYSESVLGSHAMSKVVRYPSTIKAVRSHSDGITNTVENLAFDPATGGALLTRSYDHHHLAGSLDNDYQGEVYQMSIPGHWMYPSLGQKVKDELNTNDMGVMIGGFTTYGAGANPIDDNNGVRTIIIPTNKIVAASAMTLSDSWFDEVKRPEVAKVLKDYGINSQKVLSQLNTRLRVDRSFVYKGSERNPLEIIKEDVVTKDGLTGIETVEENDAEVKNSRNLFEAGMLKGFTPFDWNIANGENHSPEGAKSIQTINEENGWKAMGYTSLYTPHSQALEEIDLLGNPSSVKFGYGDHLPVAVAANAYYGSYSFRDFELEEEKTDAIAHSGTYSISLVKNQNLKIFNSEDGSIKVDEKLAEGAIVRVWKHSRFTTGDGLEENDHHLFSVKLESGQMIPFRQIARVGEWTLHEAVLKGVWEEGDQVTPVLHYDPDANEQVYIDDLRLQPLRSQMSCFVYDPATFRVLAEFGDQHFGMYYQYDDEGKLVRKLIETERGLMTVTESQSNVVRQHLDNEKNRKLYGEEEEQ